MESISNNPKKKDDPMGMGNLNPKGIINLQKLYDQGIKKIWSNKIKNVNMGNIVSDEINRPRRRQ